MNKDPMEFFRRLGTAVETRWREQNYDNAAFPPIAAAALAEYSPALNVDPWEIIRSVGASFSLPSQQDAEGRFGNPPITLFNSSRFYIDVYFWLDGTTSIHQHGFAGAFQVLLGSSLHSHYEFFLRQAINAQFEVGEIALKGVQLLSVGDIKQIIPGRAYIHSLFHLDRPSATITVRTYQIPTAQPQFSYLKPHIAHDPFFKEINTTRKLQALELLLRMPHPDCDSIIKEVLSLSDFHTTFMILALAYPHLVGNEMKSLLGVTQGATRFDELLATARNKHGELVDLLPAVFEEDSRKVNLVSRRSTITSSEHRFFLALLMNVTGRERILDLVEQRFPGKAPIETVVDWVEQLATIRVFGSTETNVLGINGFDDYHLLTFQCLLEGKSLDQTIETLNPDHADGVADNPGERIARAYATLKSSPLFKSLFEASSVVVRQ